MLVRLLHDGCVIAAHSTLTTASRMSKGGADFAHDKDDAVLCFHGPLIYEAHITDRVARDGPDYSKIKLYFVHYSGWNAHWDEWVPESRVLKKTPENHLLQKSR